MVRHPERYPWLESGEDSLFFHPMHKPGIFRHTLSYMTTMEIGSFTYRFLCRNTNESQLLKYQHHKENSYIIYKTKVSQLLYSILYKKRQEIPDVIIIRKVPDCFQDGRVWWFVHFHQPISTGSHSQYDIQAYLYNCRTKDVAGIFQGPYLFQTDA